MPKKQTTKSTQPKKKKDNNIKFSFGTVSEKQQQFLDADTFFVCYGGARGGGKTHVARLKAVGLMETYPGIRILMVRAHYPELEENLVRPILKWLPQEMYKYNGTSHLLTFYNGSIIKFGHWDGDDAENEYQGVEYDVIFLEEATQLSERAFQYLQTCIRGANDFPKRMYLTCNPGGVGHAWVKRLFIKRDYRNDPENPERNENPDDYTFIFATVDDNPWVLKSSPMYLKNLANLPDDLRAAHRYGDWDVMSGNYFKGFSPATHVMPHFAIPKHWKLYRSFDYGLDMFSVGWFAVDEDGRSWLYREFEQKDLIVQDAAAATLEHTLQTEAIQVTYAPPDMWSRMKNVSKTVADIFIESGLPLFKSDNNRVQGHMIMKDMMSPIPLTDPFVKGLFKEGEAPEKLPGLMFFDTVQKVIDDIIAIQADDKNPNDCAKQPHDVTHTVDMCRYFCINRVMEAVVETPPPIIDEEFHEQDYESFMCGGEIGDAYVEYGG